MRVVQSVLWGCWCAALMGGALTITAPVRAEPDCQSVMLALGQARSEATDAADVVDTLQGAIASPSWDPVGDGWMVDALGWAVEDMVGAFNTVASIEQQAHAAHCYLNTR